MPTSGPTSEKPTGFSNIGQAAHITAAASGPGAARYDPSLTPEQRSDIENGIWLCQNCATMIDRDAVRFPVKLLKKWKQEAERAAQEEQGSAPLSRNEFDLLRASVFKLPLGRSVATAVADMSRMGAEELERLDPRFAVEISTRGSSTRIALRAKEPVHFTADVAPHHQAEYRDKMRDLAAHGTTAEMSSGTIHLSGSVLLDLIAIGDNGVVKFSSNQRRRAVQKVSFQDPITQTVISIDDFVGEVFGGSESITFEGATFNDLLGMRYRYLHSTNLPRQTQIIDITPNYEVWRGRTIRSLSYFDKLYKFFESLRSGWNVSFTLEVDGISVLSGEHEKVFDAEAIKELWSFLRYVKWIRDLLAFWGQDLPFQPATVSTEEMKAVHRAWSFLCARPAYRGSDISSTSCRIVVQGETSAIALRRSVLSTQAETIILTGSIESPLNLMGTYVSAGAVDLRYSRAVFRSTTSLENIKDGDRVDLTIEPAEDCVLSLSPSSDTPFCVIKA
jgi:hypothetical protein